MRTKLPHIYNGRPDGLTENRDCAVLALAAVLCVPYTRALALLTDAGRKPGRGTYQHQVLGALAAAGVRYAVLYQRDLRGRYREAREPRITAARVRDYLAPRGHYYVSAGGHAFAVIDGTVYDNGMARPRAIVSHVIRLELE